MSTVNESPSLRLTHTDERYQDVKKAYHHLYMWLRDGRVDEETDRHTLWWRNGDPSFFHDEVHRNLW